MMYNIIMLRGFEADSQQGHNTSFARRGVLVVASAISMMPAVFGVSSAESHTQEPLQDNYPQNIVSYGVYGFHTEVEDRQILPSGDPERLNAENCVNLALNSLRKYSFQTSRDGKRVRESITADSVEECDGIVDRKIDIHFDMDRMATRDIVGPDKPIKEKGLDPNSKVKVLESEAPIRQSSIMRLLHKLTPKIGKKRRNFQMVVGVNAIDNTTGEMYRKSHKAKIKYTK